MRDSSHVLSLPRVAHVQYWSGIDVKMEAEKDLYELKLHLKTSSYFAYKIIWLPLIKQFV